MHIHKRWMLSLYESGKLSLYPSTPWCWRDFKCHMVWLFAPQNNPFHIFPDCVTKPLLEVSSIGIPYAPEISHSTSMGLIIFLYPSKDWLPFRNLMTATVALQVLSAECPSQEAPRNPHPHQPGQVLCCHTAWKRGPWTLWGHTVGAWPNQRNWQSCLRTKGCCLWLCTSFPNISLFSLKTPRTNVIPWVSGHISWAKKVHTSATRQKGTGTKTGRLVPQLKGSLLLEVHALGHPRGSVG